ncbi:hypothetical protein V6N13_072962 [Hibiscus sabdariffa]
MVPDKYHRPYHLLMLLLVCVQEVFNKCTLYLVLMSLGPSVVAAQPEAHAGSSLHGTSIHGISPICSQGAELDANEDVVRCTDTWSPDCHPPSIVDLSSVTQSFVDVDPPVVEAQKDVELSILDLGGLVLE